MPELRHDTVTGALTIVAPERAARPTLHRDDRTARYVAAEACPFCPGNERETEREIGRTGPGAPDTPGWRVRVFPNRYPAVEPSHGAAADGVAATGAHEVVVLTPDHDIDLARLPTEAATEGLAVMRDRVGHLHREGRRHAMAFVNHGRGAGASLSHLHAQVLGLDLVPPGIAAELGRFASAGGDLVERSLAEARDAGTLVLDGPAPAWCPLGSAAAYEVLVVSEERAAHVERASDAAVADVAASITDVVGRVVAALGDVPYNVVVHGAPADHDGPYRWYVRVLPRIAVRAGFELATGIVVNPVPAESAATVLREADPSTVRAGSGRVA